MSGKKSETSDVLEKGDIFFFYRPKVERRGAEGKRDVQRFFMVLHPEKKRKYRLAVIGRKRLPQTNGGGDKTWCAITTVAKSAGELKNALSEERYETKTRGSRFTASARAGGEGRYAIVRHGDHTHLAYELELPAEPGKVQRAFDIERQGSFILSVKNPESPSPRKTGLKPEQKADFPPRLQKAFGGRRFSAADPSELLDFAGAELLLIGSGESPMRELGIRLDTEKENEKSAEIFRDLKLHREENPVTPLFKGAWA